MLPTLNPMFVLQASSKTEAWHKWKMLQFQSEYFRCPEFTLWACAIKQGKEKDRLSFSLVWDSIIMYNTRLHTLEQGLLAKLYVMHNVKLLIYTAFILTWMFSWHKSYYDTYSIDYIFKDIIWNMIFMLWLPIFARKRKRCSEKILFSRTFFHHASALGIGD